MTMARRSLLHTHGGKSPLEEADQDDPHDVDVCDIMIHYLPWLLILTMVFTAFASGALVAIVVSRRVARRD